MPVSSTSHAVLLITGDDDGCVPLTRAFLRATPKVHLSSVNGAPEGREYLSGAGEYADRVSYPTPQVILLDPDKEPNEALAVLEWLKENSALRCIPVVILTGLNESRVIDQAYALGASSCLLKSVDEEVTNDLATGIACMQHWSATFSRRAQTSVVRRTD
jgi:DNA-binding NarL/FixJ family response regulator